MSAQELMLGNSKTPVLVATDFLAVIKDIELCIEDSSAQVSKIEKRGMFKSMFTSSRSDLLEISRSQNKINEMMLGLIQEVITLNTMSYSFLAAVIAELETRCREGWIDGDGRIQQLSDTGRQFADRATDIFGKILDGSKSTQSKIELNQQSIAELQQQFMAKAQMVLKNSEAIDSLKHTLSDKAVLVQQNQQAIHGIQQALHVKEERLSALDERLLEKAEALDQQGRKIHSLIEELQENQRMDTARGQALEALQAQLEDIQRQGQGRDQRLTKLDEAAQGQRQQIQALTELLQQNYSDTFERTGKLKAFSFGLGLGLLVLAGATVFNTLRVL
jgi:uncharacterized phage infection (PIP) family protein YhgE